MWDHQKMLPTSCLYREIHFCSDDYYPHLDYYLQHDYRGSDFRLRNCRNLWHFQMKDSLQYSALRQGVLPGRHLRQWRMYLVLGV